MGFRSCVQVLSSKSYRGSSLTRLSAHLTVVVDKDETDGESPDAERDDDEEENELVRLVGVVGRQRPALDVTDVVLLRPDEADSGVIVRVPGRVAGLDPGSGCAPPLHHGAEEGEGVAEVLLAGADLVPAVPVRRAVLQGTGGFRAAVLDEAD